MNDSSWDFPSNYDPETGEGDDNWTADPPQTPDRPSRAPRYRPDHALEGLDFTSEYAVELYHALVARRAHKPAGYLGNGRERPPREDRAYLTRPWARHHTADEQEKIAAFTNITPCPTLRPGSLEAVLHAYDRLEKMPLVTRTWRPSRQRMAARSRKVVSMAEFQERLGNSPATWRRPGEKEPEPRPADTLTEFLEDSGELVAAA